MRIGWVAVLFPLAAFSQAWQADSVARGVLLKRDASEFSVRAPDNEVLRFTFDRRTSVERDHETIDMARLGPGDQVEVISEKLEGIALRHALTVHLLPPWFPLTAFSNSQSGILMGGVLLECDASEFSIRAADTRVFRYQYDRSTYVERDHQTTDMAHLPLGERVEVISEKIEGMPLRYAQTVHALPPAPPRGAGPPGAPAAADRPLPYGAFSITGLVFRMAPGVIAVHTRTGDLNVILRWDTRYLADGVIVEPSALKLNMHVLVQAGNTKYGELQAYRVVWGSVFRP